MKYCTILLSLLVVHSYTLAADPVLHERIKLLDEKGAEEDRLGVSIAVDNGLVVMGGFGSDINGNFSGIAHVFSAEAGMHVTKLLPEDGESGDALGGAVAIEGNTVVVGATQDDDLGGSSGSVYVFEATGALIHKLHASDGKGGDNFGSSVAIHHGMIAIGASGASRGNGSSTGAAYVFDAVTGHELAKFVPDETGHYGRFGVSIAIEDSIVVVGSSNNRAAYVFDWTAGVQLHKLESDEDRLNHSWFGWSIAMESGLVAVGAFQDDDHGLGSGAVYVFDVETGAQIHQINSEDSDSYDQFGIDVDIDHGVLVVGSNADDDNGNASGSAYLFDIVTGEQLVKLRASDGGLGDSFGGDVAIGGDVIAIGASRDDDIEHDAGAGYVFDNLFVPCLPDLNGDGILDSSDVSAFLAAFQAQDFAADFVDDGRFNYFDISVFLQAFEAGCP